MSAGSGSADVTPNGPAVLAVVSGDRIRVKASFDDKDALKAIVGARWDKAGKYWHYPASPTCAADLHAAFSGRLRVDGAFNDLLTWAGTAEASRALRDRTDLEDFPGTVPAWEHQRQAFHFAYGQMAAYLGVGMGGGKTKITIGLMEAWACKRVLIVCPPSVIDVWPKEFDGDPDTGKPGHAVRRWTIIADPKGTTVAKRTMHAREAWEAATDQTPVCVVVNYEAFYRDPFMPWLQSLTGDQLADLIALDEGHRIKAPGGVQSKAAEKLRKISRRRLVLSGTPMPHGPLDVYAQCRFLDPGVFGTSHARFRQRYALMGGWQGKEVLGIDPEHEAELTAKFRSLAYIITKEDLDKALDLPPQINLPWLRTNLDGPAQRAYTDLDQEFVTDVKGGTVTVDNALTRLLRLQQVTSGHLPVDRPCPSCDAQGCHACKGTGMIQTVEHIGDEKKRLLADRLTDLPVDEPVVVYARFHHDLDSIKAVAESQGRRYGELSGRDKGGLTSRATMNPDVDVLAVQLQSGGVGIDLTRAHYAIYYSLGFDLGLYEQSRARVHRHGQTRPTYYDHLIASGTVDELVMRALIARKDIVTYVLDAVRNGEL